MAAKDASRIIGHGINGDIALPADGRFDFLVVNMPRPPVPISGDRPVSRSLDAFQILEDWTLFVFCKWPNRRRSEGQVHSVINRLPVAAGIQHRVFAIAFLHERTFVDSEVVLFPSLRNFKTLRDRTPVSVGPFV